MNWLKKLWVFAATAVSVLLYLLLDQVRSWVDAHGFWLYVAGVVLITVSVYLAEYANEWRKNRKSIDAGSSAARVEQARAVKERDEALAAKETAEESLAAALANLATEQEAHNRSRQQNTERLRELLRSVSATSPTSSPGSRRNRGSPIRRRRRSGR